MIASELDMASQASMSRLLPGTRETAREVETGFAIVPLLLAIPFTKEDKLCRVMQRSMEDSDKLQLRGNQYICYFSRSQNQGLKVAVHLALLHLLTYF